MKNKETLEELLIRKGVDQSFVDAYLIRTDQLTEDEMKDLGYVEDRIDTHLSIIGEFYENSELD